MKAASLVAVILLALGVQGLLFSLGLGLAIDDAEAKGLYSYPEDPGPAERYSDVQMATFVSSLSCLAAAGASAGLGSLARRRARASP